jgi:hypothetical protein
MLWPLDEGAAVPLCVRMVDQAAPDGAQQSRLFLVQRSVVHGACDDGLVVMAVGERKLSNL